MAVYYGVVKGHAVELPPDAQVADGVEVEVRVLDTNKAQDDQAEERFKQQLLDAGLLTEIRRPPRRPSTIDRTPIVITGMPISETIIEERR